MAAGQFKLSQYEALENKYGSFINEASRQHKVDKNLLMTMILQESGGDPNAVSPKKAKGLMQIMPATFKEETGYDPKANPHDPKTSILTGAKYMRKMLDRYNGDTELALAAYNAGMGRVKDKIPNNKETPQYVRNIASAYQWKTEQDKLPIEKREILSPSPYNYSLQKALSVRNAEFAEHDKYVKTAASVQASTASQWINNAWSTFKQASPVTAVLDEMKMRNQAVVDPNYKYDAMLTSTMFAKRGISFDEVTTDFMSKSQSMQDFNNRLDLLAQNKQLQDIALQNISQGWYKGISMGGAVFGDPSIVLGLTAVPAIMARAGLAARAVSTYGTSAAIQLAVSSFKNEYVAGHTGQDVVIDTLFGSLIEGTLAKGMFKPKVSIIGDTGKILETRESVSSALVVSPTVRNITTSRSYQWGTSPRQVTEAFTDVEFIDTAKQLGYKGDEPLLLTDKNIRGQVAKAIEESRVAKATDEGNRLAQARAEQIAKQEAKTAERTAKKEAQTAEAKQKIDEKVSENRKLLEQQFVKSGLSRDEFNTRIDNLTNDVTDIRTLIDEVTSYADTPTKTRMLKDLSQMIDEIEKVSPANAEALRFKLNKQTGKVATPKVTMTEDGKLAFNSGKKSFDKILKGFTRHINSKVKKLDDLTKEAKKQSNLSPKPSAGKKAILDSLNRQKEIFERMKSAMDELNFAFQKSLDDLMLGRFADDVERKTFLDELSKAINDEFGSNITLTWKNNKIQSTGGIEFRLKNDKGLNKKSNLKIAMGALLAFGGTAAFASNGEDDGVSVIPYVMGIALAYAIGSTAVIRLLEKKAMKQAVADHFTQTEQIEKIATMKSDPFYKNIVEKMTTIDNYRTGYLESLAYILKHGTPEQITLARQLVRDWVDPQKGIAADSEKLSNLRAAETRLMQVADEQYHLWLDDNKLKDEGFEKYAFIGMDSPMRKKFEEDVAEFLEFGGENAHPAVVKFANQIKKERDLAVKELNRVGAAGYGDEDIAKFKENYLSRYVNRANWRQVIGNPENRQNLITSLASSMARAMGKQGDDPAVLALADSYIDTVTKIHLSDASVQVPDVEAMLAKMKAVGLDVDGIDVASFVKEIHRDSDMLSRGKMRIPMNLKHFTPFTIKIDGEYKLIDATVLFDRNALNATRRYLNESYGYAAAIKATGYKSYGLLIDEIAKSGTDTEVAVKLKTYADSVFGRPTLDTNSEFTKNILAFRTMSNVVLATSVLTTFYEMFKAVGATYGKSGSKLARQQFLYSTGNLVKSMFGKKNFNKTWLAKHMTDNVNGLGGATLRGDINFKAIDDIINLNDATAGALRDIARKTGFVGLFMSKLIQLDDFYKNIANIYAATNLARIANGKFTIPAEKIAMYGIDSDAINRLKKFLKLDEDDEIIDFDYDKLDQADKDLFRNLSERIVMDRSTWTTLSGIPTGSINNAAGVLLSSLTHFMAQTYTTQFIAKVKYGGVSNYTDMALWVAAGYTTYYAKAYATGKEPKHEDAIMYAILSSPIMSPVNIAGMMIDPIALSVMQNITNYARSNVEYAIEGVTE